MCSMNVYMYSWVGILSHVVVGVVVERKKNLVQLHLSSICFYQGRPMTKYEEIYFLS
jgi:hypothetical protein